MTERHSSAAKAAGPTVRRVEHQGEELGATHREQLARVVEQGWVLYADAAVRTAKLEWQAYEPIQRLIEGDAAAKAALGELRERRIAEVETRMHNRRVAQTFGGPPAASLIPSLHAGINVFAAPFDFEVRGPNRGEDEASTNRLSGTFKIHLAWGKQGARWATAGVGMALQAGVTGFAHIRPTWRYDYSALAAGRVFSAHTEGAAKVVVQDALTGVVLKDITRPLWNFGDTHGEGQDGYIDSWALGADVFVQAGQIFTVSFLGTALVDDSGTDYLIGWSLACATMEMRVPFFVLELGPS